MIDINPKDFVNMKWAIQDVPRSTKVVDQFASLKNIFLEFLAVEKDGISNDELIRYIVLCYHRQSPFVEKIESPIERKINILEYLKIESKTDDIQKILKSNEKDIGLMIIQFCKFENSLAYFAFVQTVETYLSMNTKLGQDLAGAKESKDTADVMIKLDKVEERIDKLADKLFQRDKDLKDFIGSVLVMEGRSKKIVPEDYAV